MHLLEIKTRITSHPREEATPESSDKEVILECQAEEASSYKWEKEDGDLPTHAQGADSNTLTLTNLSQNDDGEYRCEVTGDGGSVYSNYAKVTVGE